MRIVLILVGALCAVAITAPLASAARKHHQACSGAGATVSQYPGWVTLTDDTGVPYLYPASLYPVAPLELCAATAPAATPQPTSPADGGRVLPSPYPGWVFVLDDLGVPMLEPVELVGG